MFLQRWRCLLCGRLTRRVLICRRCGARRQAPTGSYFTPRQGLRHEHGTWCGYLRGRVVAHHPDRDVVAVIVRRHQLAPMVVS